MTIPSGSIVSALKNRKEDVGVRYESNSYFLFFWNKRVGKNKICDQGDIHCHFHWFHEHRSENIGGGIWIEKKRIWFNVHGPVSMKSVVVPSHWSNHKRDSDSLAEYNAYAILNK